MCELYIGHYKTGRVSLRVPALTWLDEDMRRDDQRPIAVDAGEGEGEGLGDRLLLPTPLREALDVGDARMLTWAPGMPKRPSKRA